MPTNVPPSNKAEATIPGRVDQRTLAATPAASSAQARAKAFALPILFAQNPQNAIEGAAASPTRSQTKGSELRDRKSTRLNSSHVRISYAVFCLKKKRTR